VRPTIEELDEFLRSCQETAVGFVLDRRQEARVEDTVDCFAVRAATQGKSRLRGHIAPAGDTAENRPAISAHTRPEDPRTGERPVQCGEMLLAKRFLADFNRIVEDSRREQCAVSRQPRVLPRLAQPRPGSNASIGSPYISPQRSTQLRSPLAHLLSGVIESHPAIALRTVSPHHEPQAELACPTPIPLRPASAAEMATRRQSLTDEAPKNPQHRDPLEYELGVGRVGDRSTVTENDDVVSDTVGGIRDPLAPGPLTPRA